MVMRTLGSRHTAESVDDLAHWVERLDGCPTVTRTMQALCQSPAHGDEPAPWFYVEADAADGVARLRCLSGGHIHHVLDSHDRWTFPHTWSCRSCNQSIAEVVYGVHAEDQNADWMVMGARCVECGDVAGLTDFVIAPTDVDELFASL